MATELLEVDFDNFAPQRFQRRFIRITKQINSELWRLADYKFAQYVLNMVRSGHMEKVDDAHFEAIGRLLGGKALLMVMRRILRIGEGFQDNGNETSQKVSVFLKSLQEDATDIQQSLSKRPNYSNGLRWSRHHKTISEDHLNLYLRNDAKERHYSYWDIGYLQGILLRYWSRYPILKAVDRNDFLLKGMQQLRDDLRLSPTQCEVILACFLAEHDPKINSLLTEATIEAGIKVEESLKINSRSLALLLDQPPEKLAKVISGAGGLFDMGLLEYDGTLSVEIQSFLNGSALGGLLDIFGKPLIHDALPLESFGDTNQYDPLILLLQSHDGRFPFHVLLHGVEGTGKTELARSLAKASGKTLIEVGRNLDSCQPKDSARQEDAVVRFRLRALRITDNHERGKSALLLVDDADSLIQDRREARSQWEISMVNEFLIQLEQCQCLVVCSTNFQGSLDPAARRRFHFHLGFEWLTQQGIDEMFVIFFPHIALDPSSPIRTMTTLAPGDFYAVYSRLKYLDYSEKKHDANMQRAIMAVENLDYSHN